MKRVLQTFALALVVAAACMSLLRPAYAQSATAEQAESGGQQSNGEAAKGEEEKDQTEQFKHSSSVRLIGRILGLDSQRSYWIAALINFAVIAALIVWAGRKELPKFFRTRTESIQKAMQEAQKASAEARTRLSDIESRLARLDSEIGSMRDTAEKEAAAEEQRIKAATEEEARKIVAMAEQEIAAAAKAAKRELTAHAADLAVGLAQKQIHVDTATDQALVRSFAGQLGETTDNIGWQGDRKDRN